MFTEEYSRYTLLAQGNSSTSRNFDRRTVILVSALTLPVFIFCVTYMTLFGIYEKVVYPHNLIWRELHQQCLHRAKAYNTYPRENNVSNDLHFKIEPDNSIPNYRLVCYYNFPSSSQSLQIKDLEPSLCTHINIAFAQVVNKSIFLSERDENSLAELVKLKNINKDLKILLSVGGSEANGFADMVLNHTNRKTFIQSAEYYVKNYKIDGIDLDWEFPNEEQDGDKKQRTHFTQLLEEFRHTINRQTSKFLLSVAVAAPKNIIDNSYDVSYMNDFVDYINLMSYDYHYFTKFTPFTGINAPLYSTSTENFYLATLNINYSVNYWNSLGMERSKIVVGLPTYGHTFRLTNIMNNGLYAPAYGYGKLGSLGFADYAQICTFLTSNHISPVFEMDTKSPYASKFSEWISFDNAESFTYKAEYIRDNKLGGAMIYSLNSDDYRGVCKSPGGNVEKFPLIRVVKQILVDKENPY